MAFSAFSYPAVIADLSLSERIADLFPAVPPVVPGAAYRAVAVGAARLAQILHTEKARSEWMVAPLLYDFWVRYDARIGLYSGVQFDADPDAGLTGVCDFVIGSAPQLPHLTAPLVVVFESKNDSIPEGFGQCISAMVGAQRYNRKHGGAVETVYGCATTGSSWKFLTLVGNVLTFDLAEYNLGQADKILGILVHMVGPPPAGPSAT